MAIMSLASYCSLCHSLSEGLLWEQKDETPTGGAGQKRREHRPPGAALCKRQEWGIRSPLPVPFTRTALQVCVTGAPVTHRILCSSSAVFSPFLPPLTTPLVLPEITSQITGVHVRAQSCPSLCNSWTAAHQAPPSTGFSRHGYQSGLPRPPPPTRTQIPFGAPLLGGSQTEHFSLSERNPGQKGLRPLFVTTPLL